MTLEPTDSGDDEARTSWPRTKGFGILIVSHSEFERARKLVLEVNEFVWGRDVRSSVLCRGSVASAERDVVRQPRLRVTRERQAENARNHTASR